MAILAAATDAALVASLSLIAPLGLGTGANTKFVQRFVKLDNESAAVEVLQQTVFDKRLISRRLIQPLLVHLERDGVRTTQSAIARDVLDSCDEIPLAIRRISTTPLPRQVIWGLNDDINTLVIEDETRFGGDWHTLEDCGHLPHVEHRVTVNRLLADLLQRSSGHKNCG